MVPVSLNLFTNIYPPVLKHGNGCCVPCSELAPGNLDRAIEMVHGICLIWDINEEVYIIYMIMCIYIYIYQSDIHTNNSYMLYKSWGGAYVYIYI